MVKTTAEQSEKVGCENCGNIIYQCDSCQEYFTPGDEIYCDEKGDHFCSACKGA
jgi:hypothetical protein